MKTKLQVLQEVNNEFLRFRDKLALAMHEQSILGEINGSSNKHYASVKRAAYDLKNELTKLTQDSVYRWKEKL